MISDIYAREGRRERLFSRVISGEGLCYSKKESTLRLRSHLVEHFLKKGRLRLRSKVSWLSQTQAMKSLSCP
jgi:hypothetical protein